MLFGNSSPAGTGNQSTWLSGDGHFLSLFIPCPPTIPSCKRPGLAYIRGSVNGHTLTCRLAVSMPPVRGECPEPAFYAAGHTCQGILISRSEEHKSELQSRGQLVGRLLLDTK